jgi:NAD(P)-dependent dehydrogenase (short-subunit alcohol dehydrogenase family)
MKTAIITGAGSGIGAASARLLANEGFRVGLIARNQQPIESLSKEIMQAGGEAWSANLDVRQRKEIDKFVSQTVNRYKKIDLLVNSAGVFKLASFEETTSELWDETLDINLTGAYNFCKGVWPHIHGGQIINISSVAGVKPFSGCAAYSASKYGLMGLGEVLALEGKVKGIRVHTICPGNTNTPIWENQASSSVIERMMDVDQVAEVVRWLAMSPKQVSFEKIVLNPSKDPWKD